MRYGIVREAPNLPPVAEQMLLLEGVGCDVLLQEGPATLQSQRRLTRLLFTLKSGDEVLVPSLDVFQRTTGELAQMIRTFLELGVSLQVLDEGGDTAPLTASDGALQVLSLLAAHETRRPRAGPAGLNSGSRNQLSRYQLNYARKLYREGASLRAIGLLFQVSPSEVWEAIGAL